MVISAVNSTGININFTIVPSLTDHNNQTILDGNEIRTYEIVPADPNKIYNLKLYIRLDSGINFEKIRLTAYDAENKQLNEREFESNLELQFISFDLQGAIKFVVSEGEIKISNPFVVGNFSPEMSFIVVGIIIGLIFVIFLTKSV